MEEKKLSMYNLWSRPSIFLVSCHVLFSALPVLPLVYFHIICVFSRVTKFENFDTETLVFLWYVLFENHPPFEGNNNFINSQIFRRVVEFAKCSEFQTGLVSSVVCQNFQLSCQVHSRCQ